MSETIQGLDAEIARLDAAMAELFLQQQALRRRRNDLVFIIRCPDEILVEIFMNTHASEVAAKFHSYPHALAALPRVCARWCTVTCSSPRLWSLFDLFYSPQTVQRMLARSAENELELWAQMRDFEACTNLGTITRSAHCARVRLLDVDVQHCPWPAAVRKIIELVPALTNLRLLKLRGLTEGTCGRLDDFPLVEISQLRRLIAFPIYPANLWSLPSLVLLVLRKFDMSSATELSSFLQATARNCPNLCKLEIHGTAASDWHVTHAEAFAHFRSLKTVDIRLSSPQTLDAIVSFLSVPTTCCIYLELKLTSDISSLTFPSLRAYTERRQWTIVTLELKVVERGAGVFVYTKVGDFDAKENMMTMWFERPRASRDWKKHQRMVHFLLELFPGENLLHVSLVFAKTEDENTVLVSKMTRQAGEKWPVEDVAAELLARVTPQSRAIVARKSRVSK